MRRTKESLAKPPDRSIPDTVDAQEAANEEHYEEIGGERATEGVGPGFDADAMDTDEETREATADGPLSGDVFEPPTERPAGRPRRKKRGVSPPHGPSNHPAARSSKTI